MKKLSKVLVLVLSAVMVLAMSASVFAASDRTTETDGSVTVSNPSTGQTYTLYKLFDADVGANNAITYTTSIDLTGNEWFELNSNGFVVAKEGVSHDWAKDPEAIAWAKANGAKVGDPIVAADGTDVAWTGLAYGYYFVDTTMGSFIGIDSANNAATIQEKNFPPKVKKEIVSTTNGVVNTDKDAATAQVGDTVTYKLTVEAKPGAENYKVTDTLSAGLTAPAASAVTVTDLVLTQDYTVVVSGQEITVSFTKAYLDTITENTSIVINYTATLNGSAVVGAEGNDNKAVLTWGHEDSESVNKSEDEAKVYTAQVSLTKTDSSEKGLGGAEFALKNAAGKYYKKANDGVVTWIDAVGEATKFTSNEDGTFDSAFTGLTNGSYVLEETITPEGYNAISPDDASLKFTIEANAFTDANLMQATTVVNNAGTVLPTTGGIGTTIFYILGSALVIGCGIVLISRKRMQKK